MTCLVYSDPLLMVGTQGGYLLIFSIHTKHHLNRTRHASIPTTVVQSLPNSPRLSLGYHGHGRKLDYHHVAATHCCARPIIKIHPLAVPGGVSGTSPYLGSPSQTLNLLVLFGETSAAESEGLGVNSCVHLYEIVSSPLGSPMVSPQSTITGRLSTSSSQSLPASAHRKCSLQDLESMPKLSISRVSKGALSFLPLQDNSVETN